MVRFSAYVFAAVAPLLGWAAVSLPQSTGDRLGMVAAGFFLALAGTALPRGLGLFVLAWWLGMIVVYVPPLSPQIADALGLPVLAVPSVPDVVVRPVAVALTCGWWWVALAHTIRAMLEPAPDTDDGPEDAADDAPPAAKKTPIREVRREPGEMYQADPNGAIMVGHGEPLPPAAATRAPVSIRQPVMVDLDDGQDTPDDDSWTARAASVWPTDRRHGGGKVSIVDLAHLLGEDPATVADGLTSEGVDVERVSVRPATRKGTASRKKAVSWSALRP